MTNLWISKAIVLCLCWTCAVSSGVVPLEGQKPNGATVERYLSHTKEVEIQSEPPVQDCEDFFYRFKVSFSVASTCATSSSTLDKIEAIVLDRFKSIARTNAENVARKDEFVAMDSESEYAFCPKPFVHDDRRFLAQKSGGVRRRLDTEQVVSFVGGGMWELCYADGLFSPRNETVKRSTDRAETTAERVVEESQRDQQRTMNRLVEKKIDLETKWERAFDELESDIDREETRAKEEIKEMKKRFEVQYSKLKKKYDGQVPTKEEALKKRQSEELKKLKERLETEMDKLKATLKDYKRREKTEMTEIKKAIEEAEDVHSTEIVSLDMQLARLQAIKAQQKYLEKPEHQQEKEKETAILDVENVLRYIRRDIRKGLKSNLWKVFGEPGARNWETQCFAMEPELIVKLKRVQTESEAVPDESHCKEDNDP